MQIRTGGGTEKKSEVGKRDGDTNRDRKRHAVRGRERRQREINDNIYIFL